MLVPKTVLVTGAGPWPIRTTVGDDMGLVRINRHTALVQSDLIQVLGDV